MRKVSDIEPDNSVYEQFYNIVMRDVLETMGMEQVGRHYYDRSKAIEMPEDRLTLWPGFITAIRRHEAGMMLCVEVTHKVLRNETAYDVMHDIGRDIKGQRGNRPETEVARAVVGCLSQKSEFVNQRVTVTKIHNFPLLCRYRRSNVLLNSQSQLLSRITTGERTELMTLTLT